MAPRGVVEALYLTDSSHVRYHTRVARECLQQAASCDSLIAAAYRREELA
jgi:hypothetical protein